MPLNNLRMLQISTHASQQLHTVRESTAVGPRLRAISCYGKHCLSTPYLRMHNSTHFLEHFLHLLQ
jgi:hypothetical protein